jgi:hypothetical protein
MNEAEWLTCCHVRTMLDFIRGRVSERKLWLFAVACLREGPWDRLPAAWQASVEVEERFADGRATESEVNASWQKRLWPDAEGIVWEVQGQAWAVAQDAASDAFVSTIGRGDWTQDKIQTIGAAQCELLRDIVGNPFSPPVPLSSQRLISEGDTIRMFAQSLYDDRRFESLPHLAQMLEKAGCAELGLVTHLRQPTKHVRGCWALDLLLGLE